MEEDDEGDEWAFNAGEKYEIIKSKHLAIID